MVIKDRLKIRNKSLDFFRGIMALCVCLGHFYYWNNKPIVPLSFILSVDFFLVLSGFVLSHSTLFSLKFDSMIFLKRRYFRLFPVYIFCVILSILVMIIWKHYPRPNIFDIFRILTISEMIPLNPRSIFPQLEPLGISYTISSELYVGVIFFPFMYCINKHFSEILFPTLLMLLISCLIILNNTSITFMDAHHRMYNLFIDYSIIRCTMDYSIGMIAYLISLRIKSMRFVSILQFLLIALYIYMFCKLSYDRNYEFLAPFIFMAMIILLSLRVGLLFRLTNNKIGDFMGDISYPLYLIHPVFIFIFTHSVLFKYKYIVILYVVSCIFSSYLINRFVEKPSINYFSNRRI